MGKEQKEIKSTVTVKECGPRRKVQPVEYIDYEPWDGKSEPNFQVQPPRDGKR